MLWYVKRNEYWYVKLTTEAVEGTTLNTVEQELAGLEQSIQDKQDKKNK